MIDIKRPKRWIAAICVLQILIMLPQVFSWSAVWDEPGHLVAGMRLGTALGIGLLVKTT